jgi:hypothetical protein
MPTDLGNGLRTLVQEAEEYNGMRLPKADTVINAKEKDHEGE